MFMGEYSHSLDQKGRLIVPAKFRDALGGKFYITRSLDPCLLIYDQEGWDKFSERLMNMPYNSQKQREMVRFFIGGAAEVEPDKQGRFILPPPLRKYGTIDKDVVFVGTGQRAELWSAEKYGAYEETKDSVEEFNRYAEELLGNGVEF